MAEVKTISINNFTTDSGVVYDKIDLHYQHFGQSSDHAPVVLIN
jgi:homoserine acetyltransferase